MHLNTRMYNKCHAYKHLNVYDSSSGHNGSDRCMRPAEPLFDLLKAALLATRSHIATSEYVGLDKKHGCAQQQQEQRQQQTTTMNNNKQRLLFFSERLPVSVVLCSQILLHVLVSCVCFRCVLQLSVASVLECLWPWSITLFSMEYLCCCYACCHLCCCFCPLLRKLCLGRRRVDQFTLLVYCATYVFWTALACCACYLVSATLDSHACLCPPSFCCVLLRACSCWLQV